MTAVFRKCLVAGVLAIKMASAWALSVQSPIYLEAHTRIMLGQLEQAVELAKSNDADLSPEQSALLMAEVYAEIGQGEKALQILSSIEPVDMHMEFKEKVLEIYAQTGNLFELQKRISSSVQTERSGLKYLALASMKKSGNGKYLKSLKTKAANRSDMNAVRDLAWVYFQIGAYAEAIKTLKGDAPSGHALIENDRVLLLSLIHI